MNQANLQTNLAQWQDELEASLPRVNDQPLIVRVYQETRSTQDIAKTFAPQPALIVADQQTAGRGRLGRSWLSSPGSSVLMSITYPINANRQSHDWLSMLTGVAVAEAVQFLVPRATVRLKWPNDVMVSGKKLAGILIETASNSAVIGIGMNVLTAQHIDPNVAARATTLESLGRTIDRLAVVQVVTQKLLNMLAASHDTGLLTACDLATLGHTQTFEQAGQRITGEVLDLDPDHGLIVRRDTGEIITLPAATTSVVN